MLYKHKTTGVLYSVFFSSFCVATQKHHHVYVSQETGEFFNLDRDEFFKTFEFIDNPNIKIQPKPRPMLEKELQKLVTHIDTDILFDTSMEAAEKLAKIRQSIDSFHQETKK